MAEPAKRPKRKRKHFKILSAFAVLFGIIGLMAYLTWVIPSGQYNMIDDPHNPGEQIREAGSYREIPKVSTVTDSATGEEITIDHRQGLWDVFMAPIKGMAERLDVIIFVLILGGFLGVVMKTGALDASLGGLLKKMNGKEKWLIPILMTLFAIGGTTYGMQEEAVAFYALIIPVMMAAGYNAMTAVMMIVLGGGVGVLASTVNPFSTGIAARTADVPLGN
ncbi:MAG: YfcC family protein, partial [Candidatus Saccharibacteria bacterium]|nr:YfcC family protein [Candidatus Saccharibacteria bacterium]